MKVAGKLFEGLFLITSIQQRVLPEALTLAMHTACNKIFEEFRVALEHWPGIPFDAAKLLFFFPFCLWYVY